MDTTPALPPPGPAWAGALMGTSITASMAGVHLGTPTGGVVTALAGAVLLVLATGGRSWLTTDLPAWSMVTMGVLALGSAADTALGFAGIHRVTWVAGTLASVIVYVPQAVALVRGTLPRTFPATLPLVTPMVAATNAAQLGHPLPGVLCFAASLAAGAPAFVLVYLASGRRPASPAVATTWIPLGIVGQSSAAALLLSGGTALADAGRVYATVMLCLGVPAAAWALRTHWGTLLRTAPAVSVATYGPAWWSATFPVGTCSLGTHQLAVSTGAGWLDAVSATLLAVLVLHVTLATAGLLAALGQRYVTRTGEWSLQRRS
jgi:tellurite resistance protein TehA-like permease